MEKSRGSRSRSRPEEKEKRKEDRDRPSPSAAGRSCLLCQRDRSGADRPSDADAELSRRPTSERGFRGLTHRTGRFSKNWWWWCIVFTVSQLSDLVSNKVRSLALTQWKNRQLTSAQHYLTFKVKPRGWAAVKTLGDDESRQLKLETEFKLLTDQRLKNRRGGFELSPRPTTLKVSLTESKLIKPTIETLNPPNTQPQSYGTQTPNLP